MGKSSVHSQQMRVRIAQEAARLMAKEGVKDFHAAKRKAAEHLGATDNRNMPRNAEIEQALDEFHRLFQPETQSAHIDCLRNTAIQAMEFLQVFNPRLVGSVLRGTAGEYADINLHLFAETTEEVNLFLMDANIPFDDTVKRMRTGHDEWREFPAFQFLADQQPVELVVFPPAGIRDAPRSVVDGKPMQRASINEVRMLRAPL